MTTITGVVLRRIGPGGRDKLPAAVEKNQEELELTLATSVLQHRESLPFERMGLAGDRD